MMTLHPKTAAVTVAATAALTSCASDEPGTSSEPASQQPTGNDGTSADSSPSGSAEPGTSRGGARVPDTPLAAAPDPSSFSAVVDNPYLPYLPGSRWVYRSSSPDEETRIVTTVTHRTRVVQGVTCVVVHDVESTLSGEVLEDTYDWYAQDDAGNVWYFGEDTTAYEDGEANKEGSWQAGVDNAQAGIIMLARPKVGDAYEQEYYEGEAEDRGAVLAVDARLASVPARYGDLLETADTTPLEPKLVEHKYYARGVGVVFEETVRGGRERVELVSARTAG